jgi:hypothetical protein
MVRRTEVEERKTMDLKQQINPRFSFVLEATDQLR